MLRLTLFAISFLLLSSMSTCDDDGLSLELSFRRIEVDVTPVTSTYTVGDTIIFSSSFANERAAISEAGGLITTSFFRLPDSGDTLTAAREAFLLLATEGELIEVRPAQDDPAVRYLHYRCGTDSCRFSQRAIVASPGSYLLTVDASALDYVNSGGNSGGFFETYFSSQSNIGELSVNYPLLYFEGRARGIDTSFSKNQLLVRTD